MILTGKAKRDFLKHLESIFSKMMYPSLILNTLIIDWLDSVGIVIETGVYPQDDNSIVFSFTIYGDKSHEEWRSFPTRKQATEAAIKLANEIYNNN